MSSEAERDVPYKIKPSLQDQQIADALDVEVDASGFDGNLTTGTTTVQAVAQALDDLTAVSMGVAAANVTVDSSSLTGILSGVTNVQAALARFDSTGIGADIFRFTGPFSAQSSNIDEWFNGKQLNRLQCTDDGGINPINFDLPGTTALTTAFDDLVTAGVPEVLTFVIEYTEPGSNSFIQIRPRASPAPQIGGTTSVIVRSGVAATLEISRVSGTIGEYVFTSIGVIGSTGASAFDTIKLINPSESSWDASANGVLPTAGVIKGNAYKVVNAPADGSGRFGEVMQDGDWVVWEASTFTSWSAEPHQWFVLPAHEVRRISALEEDFLNTVAITPTSDRNTIIRGANYTDDNGNINIKAYATPGDYSAADLNTSGDVTERTITPAQTAYLGIRLNGTLATITEDTLGTYFVYVEDASNEFRVLGNMRDDFAFQGNFASESDYLSNNAFNFANNDVVRVYLTSLEDRYNSPDLDISESNLDAALQDKVNRSDPDGTDDRLRLATLESKMDALYPLTPDVSDLTEWSDIFNPEQAVQDVEITDGYSLIADYRGDATRYESAGVTYDATGTDVVRYSGLGDDQFRSFGMKIDSVPLSNTTLLSIVDGSEVIPFVRVTSSGTYQINNFTPSTVEDQRITNQAHRVIPTGQTTLRAGSTDTATITVTEFPNNATQRSRSLQIGIDVVLNGNNTQAEHLQHVDIPADLTAQALRTFDASIYLGPLFQNRTVNVTMSYEARVSGSDLLIDIKLISAPSDVTILLHSNFVFLNYTAPATVARVDNYSTLQDEAGDYTFTGENELLISFHTWPNTSLVGVVPVAINSTGTVSQLNDVYAPLYADQHFGTVEIPDQTALSGYEFRTFAPEHALRHVDLANLITRRATQWCYGLAALRNVSTEHAVNELVDFTQGVNNGGNPVPGITTGTAAPTSTPGKAGDIFIDTVNKVIYIAIGNASSGDWQSV